MDNIFSALFDAHNISTELADLRGRQYGLQLGIVLDNEDPSNYGRVKATVASLGAKFVTDWLLRLVPLPSASNPVPNIGDTIVIGYLDGDPHQGVYLGVVQNALNPVLAGADSLALVVGNSQISVMPDTIQLAVEDMVLTISNTGVTLNGQDLVTIGARDTRNDTIVTRGY